MKLTFAIRRAQRGFSYLTVLWIASCAGIVLAGYMSMVATQNYSSMRSQGWNRSIAISEAGIEEALAHLNKNGTTNHNLFVDGWVNYGGAYFKRGRVDDGVYEVQISKESSPIITSRGSVPLVQNYAGLSAGSGPFLADIGWMRPSEGYIFRTVQVKTIPNGMFCHGLVAKYWVKLSGGAMIDSFDSSNPAYCNNGLYSSALRRDKGGVACNAGLTNYTDITGVGGTRVYGPVATGPDGTLGLTGNASIGDKAWVDAQTPGIKEGWFRDDMNMQFPDVKPPEGSFFAPSAGSIDGTNYAYVLGSDKYQMSKLKLVSSDTVLINGNALLWVTDSIDMSGQSKICIAPGASLKLYFGQPTGTGATAKLAGQGIANVSGMASNLTFYGLSSATSIDYSGGSSFAGTIYAPNADLKLAGGGNTDPNFAGASVAATITIVGTFHYAYDEALKAMGGTSGYVIYSWNEL